jgi:site-specific DNA recombinase
MCWGQYDNSPEGKLQKQLKGAIAEYEREKIRERSVRGKRGKAKAGFYIANGAPPYGYCPRPKSLTVIAPVWAE